MYPVVDVTFVENPSVPMLNAALAQSPRPAYASHITRLALHKKMGSGEADRAVLLVDYADALSQYPEFIVYLVCRNYWENDRRPFVPFIDEIKEACGILRDQFEAIRNPKLLLKNMKPVCEIYHSPKDNPIRQKLCDFLIEQGEPDYFEQERFWSNYDLEKLAKSKGYGKAEEQIRNMSAG